MRSIKTGLRAFLDANAATAGAPVYVGRAEQGTAVPFVVMQRVGTETYDTLDDPADDSLIAETFRIATYAKTDQPAHDIADDVADLLLGYTSGTAMGTDRKFEAAWLESETGDYEPPEYVDGLAIADLVLTIQHSPA